jgi:hypothetical protein
LKTVKQKLQERLKKSFKEFIWKASREELDGLGIGAETLTAP